MPSLSPQRCISWLDFSSRETHILCSALIYKIYAHLKHDISLVSALRSHHHNGLALLFHSRQPQQHSEDSRKSALALINVSDLSLWLLLRCFAAYAYGCPQTHPRVAFQSGFDCARTLLSDHISGRRLAITAFNYEQRLWSMSSTVNESLRAQNKRQRRPQHYSSRGSESRIEASLKKSLLLWENRLDSRLKSCSSTLLRISIRLSIVNFENRKIGKQFPISFNS